MKKNFFVCLLFVVAVSKQTPAQNHRALQPYTAFLQTQHTHSIDYLMGLFKTHDLVVLCERQHPEFTQYELMAALLRDKRFVKEVGNVFMEIGLHTLNPGLNQFLHTKNLSEKTIGQHIIEMQRNCSFWPVWNNANYAYFLRQVYTQNNELPDTGAINVFPSDLPFSWAGADSNSINQLRSWLGIRDSFMAAQIIEQMEKIKSSATGRKKALVIMNFRHAFNRPFPVSGGRFVNNTTFYLMEKYGNRVANVYLNTVGFNNKEEPVCIQNGKWDAAFEAVQQYDLGFDFANSPFGKDSFDYWPLPCNFQYQDVFTGMVFNGPIEKHRIISGIPGYADAGFITEIYRRIGLVMNLSPEFASKMKNYKIVLEKDREMVNRPEENNYYMLDSLLEKRNAWLPVK